MSSEAFCAFETNGVVQMGVTACMLQIVMAVWHAFLNFELARLDMVACC